MKQHRAYIENELKKSVSQLRKFPPFIHIETINQCNARCSMCGINFDAKIKKTIDDNLYNRIANEIIDNKMNVKKVMLYLDGEPLLDSRLEQRISALSSHGVWTNISSNMSLMSHKRAINIINSNLSEIYISIDSMVKEHYEHIRKGLSFDKVLDNILNFIEVRNQMNSDLKIRIQIIEQELNLDEISNFTEFWSSKIDPHTDEIVVQRKHNWANKICSISKKSEVVNAIPCIAPFGTIVIHSNGKVPMCCMDTETNFLMGDLNINKLVDIWQGEKFESIRQHHLNNERRRIHLCDGCDLWHPKKKRVANESILSSKPT